ncbi:MFS transporter [Pelagibius sp. Alg239-R121]|uniref:MFS transporter n=1 Tax=Pelagibius sp. Alg239-R121 TaxID=2993448 RepID=UPI0024A62635|nr:MFS transporter [Pelagibius sp. Alg239-R121]
MPNVNKSSSYTTVVLLGVVATVGSNSLVLSPILTDVSQGLETSPAITARAIAAYGGATALSAVLLAPLIDRFGSRKMLLRGLLALFVGIALSSFAHNWIMLALAQALAGLGAGVVLPSTYALATKTAPKGQEARVLGRVLTGWSLSLVLGVPVSAVIADALGWRACFATLGLLALATLLGLRLIPNDQPNDLGARLSFIRSLRDAVTGDIALLLMICFAYMIAFYGVYPFIGDHVRSRLGASTSFAGLFSLAYGIGFGAASLADGILDRYDAKRLFPFALLGIGLTYAAIVPAGADLSLLLGICLLWGFLNHFGLNILVLLLSAAAGEARGAVLGINSAVTYLGALSGAALFGLIYEQQGLARIALLAAGFLLAAAVTGWCRLLRGRTDPVRSGQ